MRIRISYPVETTDYMRRVIRWYYKRDEGKKMATRADLQDWYRLNGTMLDEDAQYEYDNFLDDEEDE